MVDKPETPLADIEMLDTSGMTVEERLTRLEQTVHALAQHQTSLGSSLITAHGVLLDQAKLLEDGGVREAAEMYRAENGGERPIITNPAPLINPGGHPLRKG